MNVDELQTGSWRISMRDENLRAFRNVSFTDSGMTYAAYLLDAGTEHVLIGSFPKRYMAELLNEAEELAGDKRITCAVFFGTADDGECARIFCARFPEARVIAGTALLFRLKELGASPEHTVEIRTDRTLKLGRRELSFRILADSVETPCLYVLDKAGGMLFTADAFGSFGSFSDTRVSELEDSARWLREARRYYADIRGHKRGKSMGRAVSLVRENNIHTICPSCGPVIDSLTGELLAIYGEAAKADAGTPTVAIVHSGGASVSLMAAKIAEGIKEHPVTVREFDLSAKNRDDVLAALLQTDAFLFGTGDCDGNAAKSVWDIATSLRRSDVSGKRAAVFYTHSSGDRVPDALRAYLNALDMKLDMPDWYVSGNVAEKDLKNAVDYGFGIGCSVLGIPNPRKPRLVKCLVCGEIFDASLGACPVCGVGLDQCQPVDEEEIAYRRDTDFRYLIIGGCSAGIAAAEAIRQRDGTGTIDILSAEDHLPINRPMLTKGIIDQVAANPESIYIHPEEWYAQRDIRLHLGSAATGIDIAGKTVETADGMVYDYDKLILAAGAECFMPPFRGRELEGVITIRHLADAKKLVSMMKKSKSAVVIGGGVTGLEAAGELMKSAIPVTVLEATPQIMWKQLDAASSACLRRLMKKSHIDCYEGVSIEAIEGDGHVTGVRLSDGRSFPADTVIVSCGMRARTGLAEGAGIKVNRAIEVDMFMQTSAKDVYACGDCCEYDGVNYQLVQEATAQGRVAGANAAGDSSVYYANRPLGMHVGGVGAQMYAIGDAGKSDSLKYKTVETHDEVSNRHEKYWFANGVLQGAVVINADDKIQLLTESVRHKARHADMF